ncbi:MAG: hypothetical protein KGJ13_02985 [Patescibacteria group bacterium]|nr:hypothetical protein [Patescibacteria group bacterium]
MRKAFAIITISASLLAPFAFPTITLAETATIRQEINILDSTISAATTSPEQVQLDTTQYKGTGSNTRYYFEILASVASGNATATLQRVGSSTNDATIGFTATSPTLYRVQFAPPAATTTQYDVNVAGASPSVKAARIIAIQSGNPITQTETQIEIGDNEKGLTNTATSSGALANPKYFYYDSSKWGGSISAYAEVTYDSQAVGSNKQIFVSSTAATSTVVPSDWTNSSNTIEVIGGGGSGATGTGGGSGTVTGGGSGGGYSKISKKTLTAGAMIGIHVGGIASGTWVCNATSNCASMSGLAVIVSANGGVTATSTAGALALATSTATGTVKYDGGNGVAGSSGGSGGGGAGPDGNGQDATASAGGGGDNGLDPTGTGGSTGAPPGAGGNGSIFDGSSYGSGGGGGGSTNKNNNGGAGGLYGGGGGAGKGSGNAGGLGGQGLIVFTYFPAGSSSATVVLQRSTDLSTWTDVTPIVNSGSATTATRARVSFSLTTGNYYRIVGKTANGSYPYDIYNAKIVIDQSGTPRALEPQYLLLNTDASNTTANQKYLTTFNPAEWAGGNLSFIHQADASSTASSTVNLLNVTASTTLNMITGATTTGRSALSGLPISGSPITLDVSIPQNAVTTYADRLLVDVTFTGPTSSHGTQARSGGGGVIKMRGGGGGMIKIRGGGS